jgi:hypothetical protein
VTLLCLVFGHELERHYDDEVFFVCTNCGVRIEARKASSGRTRLTVPLAAALGTYLGVMIARGRLSPRSWRSRSSSELSG